MNTKGLFDFYNVIYTYDKGDSVIKALCSGKMRFSRWADSMFKKRKAFEGSVFTCYLGNDKFMEQLLIYENRFKQSLDGYAKSNWFDTEYDRKQNPREFFTRKYHEVRKRQIELALVYIDKVRNPKNVQVQVEVERKPYYEGYSVEKITQLFDFLIKKGFLDCNTSKDEFIYYFTGVGEQPTNTLKWCRANVQLAILIGKLFDTDGKKWHKAEQIFGITHLKSSFFNASDKTFDKSEVNAFIICEFI